MRSYGSTMDKKFVGATAASVVALGEEGASAAPIRLLMVDDHAMVRRSLCGLLERYPHMRVAGEASTGQEALQWLQKETADIILLDLLLKNETGIDLLPLLQQAAPQARIIILTGWHDVLMHRRAISLGAQGLVLKDQAFDVLFKAIERVHQGEMWIDRNLMADVIADMNTSRHKPDPEIAKIATLSPREREVIELIGCGMKNKQIADRLFISETTVRHHLTSIFNKLEVTDRLELVIYAFRHKICVLD